MPNIPITLTCADYPRVMPLVTGDVKPEGIDLTLIHGRLGSWSDRAEMLRRALQDPGVHGGEASVAQHLYRVAKATAASWRSPPSCCATSPRATSTC